MNVHDCADKGRQETEAGFLEKHIPVVSVLCQPCDPYTQQGLELRSEIEEVVVLGAVVVRLMVVVMEVAVTKVVVLEWLWSGLPRLATSDSVVLPDCLSLGL
ncbi:unnamed protein product [Arctogadus glacialis]